MSWIGRNKYIRIAATIAAALIVGLIASTVLIGVETAGLTYDDVVSVPFRKVGLLLGCPKKLAGGSENPFFIERINAALSLFRAGKVEYLLVSGDNVSRGCYETIAMKDALIRNGVPAKRIICDYKGLRTLDSVIRAKEVYGVTQMTIISQEFHNRRAIFIAKHNGIDAIGFDAADINGIDGYLIKGREIFAKPLALLDIYIFDTRPKYTGDKAIIGMEHCPGALS